MFADQLNQTNRIEGKSDIELSKLNSTVTLLENIQDKHEDLELISILPSSSSSNPNTINASISSPLESEQHRFCNILDH